MKNFSFISYEKLRKTWMYQVLDLFSKQKLKHFHYLKQRFYDELVNGFYVYAKKKEKDNGDNNVDDCVNYITRYTSRPPMAENRIIKYEDDKKMIRWWYNRHEDEKYIEIYESAENFINNLILHCPDENFKMIRYYGFYSNRNKKLLEKIYELYDIKKKKRIRNLKEKKDLKNKLDHLKYRTHMIESLQKNTLLCSCGNLMKCEYTQVPLMTDSTVKNASMIAEDTLIETKCTACGHIDNVPNWIIGELAEEDRISSKHGEVEIECPVCKGPMRRVR